MRDRKRLCIVSDIVLGKRQFTLSFLPPTPQVLSLTKREPAVINPGNSKEGPSAGYFREVRGLGGRKGTSLTAPGKQAGQHELHKWTVEQCYRKYCTAV